MWNGAGSKLEHWLYIGLGIRISYVPLHVSVRNQVLRCMHSPPMISQADAFEEDFRLLMRYNPIAEDQMKGADVITDKKGRRGSPQGQLP